MLKGIPPLLTPDLLHILAAMGHGDDLALVDRNFPAHAVTAATVTGQLIELSASNTTEAAEAIFQLFPLDNFVEAPIRFMQVVGKPADVLEVHRDLERAASAAEGRAIKMESLERHAFYDAARKSFAVVQTAEARPYGCFLLKKGVIFS